MRFVTYEHRKKVAAALKPIYTAPTVEAAESELLAFADSPLGRRYPATVATWENAWERFIPFLAFPPELRRIIYTTNAVESLNYQLRKIIKNRGHFPNDDAAIKLLWLAIRDIEDKRARQRAKEKGLPATQRTAPDAIGLGAPFHPGTAVLSWPHRPLGQRLPLLNGQSYSPRYHLPSAGLDDDEASSRVHAHSPARSSPHLDPTVP